ncbi:MAG: hypothetical protein Kow00121_01570 [Elainellaceae cyanobacterium]
MVVDHIGAVLFPDIQLLRILGRFSFPLFAWLLAEGESHTSNIRRYALRLLGLGVLSQPIYMLTFQVQRPNILFVLLLGLFCLRLARHFPHWQLLIWLSGGTLATAIDMEYSGYGIAIMAAIGQFKSTWAWWSGWLLLHLLTYLIVPGLGLSQIPAIFAPLLFIPANHQQGAKARWFYLFYPLHLLVLLVLRNWLA